MGRSKQVLINSYLLNSTCFYSVLSVVALHLCVRACDLNEESNESYFHRKINVWIDVVRNTRIIQIP